MEIASFSLLSLSLCCFHSRFAMLVCEEQATAPKFQTQKRRCKFRRRPTQRLRHPHLLELKDRSNHRLAEQKPRTRPSKFCECCEDPSTGRRNYEAKSFLLLVVCIGFGRVCCCCSCVREAIVTSRRRSFGINVHARLNPDDFRLVPATCC